MRGDLDQRVLAGGGVRGCGGAAVFTCRDYRLRGRRPRDRRRGSPS
jgi:hypothetical protein